MTGEDAPLRQDPEGELYAIQRLQFTDPEQAGARLRAHFQSVIPFPIARAVVTPRSVSLNSISGSFLTDSGEKYFFKTHVEPDSVLQEYYNVQLLEEAGYPIIRPIFASQTPGRQIVVYPFLSSRTMFDLAYDVDHGRAKAEPILQAQQASDDQLWAIYRHTLRQGEETTESPVHQLFYHRLCGRRMSDFYSESQFVAGEKELSFRDLARCHWIINGVAYRRTLGELIEEAALLLNPRSSWGETIVGHGDAHNGNLFYDSANNGLVYFDPAFAGRHSPLLDITKPLFHNVFATWMYHPGEVAEHLSLECSLRASQIEVTHNYTVSPLRRQILQSKLDRVLMPFFEHQRAIQPIEESIARLRAAVLCCPLLTVNLADRERFPSSISLLGLSQCIEAASPSGNDSGLFGLF